MDIATLASECRGNLDRIFRPFERADNVEHVEGFGLGLSITKGLVSMLGGTIDVVSNVGKGTTFPCNRSA